MKTSKEIEKEFKADLSTLLKKYNAVIEAEDVYQGYSECGEDIQISIWIDPIYETDGNTVSESSYFKLGRYITDKCNL